MNYNKSIIENLPKNLQSFYCFNNKITIIENLPDNLQELNCNFNQITKIENLPDSLQEFYCASNQLSELPIKLPDSLQYLNCNNNPLLIQKYPFLKDTENNIQSWRKYHRSFKKSAKEIIQLMNDKTIFKWQNICKNINKDSSNLIKYAQLRNLNTLNKTNREICKELAIDLEKSLQIDISKCQNETGILGDEIKDIYKPFLYKLQEQDKEYCFNILELKKYIDKGQDKNPYTRSKLPIEDINSKYEELKELIEPSKLKLTNIIEDIRNNPIYNHEVMMRQLVVDLFSKMNYTEDPNDFMNMLEERINRIIDLMNEYNLDVSMNIKEIENVKEKRDKLINTILKNMNENTKQTLETILEISKG